MGYEKLFKRAKAYGEKAGLAGDSEDFAQEVLIKAFEINGPVNLEFMYLNYRNFHRADKRILSGPEGQLSGFRTISLDAPLDGENEDSAKLGDFIGESGPDVESRSELSFINDVLEDLFSRIKSIRVRRWARNAYLEWITENAI